MRVWHVFVWLAADPKTEPPQRVRITLTSPPAQSPDRGQKGVRGGGGLVPMSHGIFFKSADKWPQRRINPSGATGEKPPK